MIKTTYYQKDAPDPILEDHIVLDLVRPYYPMAMAVTHVDETGGEARTYCVDDCIILKVQRPHRLRNTTSLEKEVFFLKALEKVNDISVPYVYGYGKKGSIEYTVMSKIAGVAFRYADIKQEEKEEVLYKLGKTLFKIHQVNPLPFISSGLFPNDTDLLGVKERLHYEFSWRLKRLEDVEPSEIEYALQLGDEVLKKMTEIDTLVPIHTNPATTHTFVVNHNYSGLIDFGDAIISHPIIDIKRWGLEDRKHLLRGYFSTQKPSEVFQSCLNVAYALDHIIEGLRTHKKISRVKHIKDLLPNGFEF